MARILNTRVLGHELCNIVRFPVYYNPTVLLVVVFSYLLTAEFIALRLLLGFSIHFEMLTPKSIRDRQSRCEVYKC